MPLSTSSASWSLSMSPALLCSCPPFRAYSQFHLHGSHWMLQGSSRSRVNSVIRVLIFRVWYAGQDFGTCQKATAWLRKGLEENVPFQPTMGASHFWNWRRLSAKTEITSVSTFRAHSLFVFRSHKPVAVHLSAQGTLRGQTCGSRWTRLLKMQLLWRSEHHMIPENTFKFPYSHPESNRSNLRAASSKSRGI